MALLTVTFRDINGLTAGTSVYCLEADADNVLSNLDALSNAQIVSALITTPVDLAGANSVAVAANIESAYSKLKVGLTGPAPVGSNRQLSSTIFSVPAPIGTVVNAPEGDPLNASLVALLGLIKAADGATMTAIRSVRYARAR